MFHAFYSKSNLANDNFSARKLQKLHVIFFYLNISFQNKNGRKHRKNFKQEFSHIKKNNVKLYKISL